MNLGNLVKKLGRNYLIRSFLSGSVLISPFYLNGCETKTIIMQPPQEEEPVNANPPFTQEYNNITGVWDLSTRTNFSNNEFTGSLDVNLNLTQTNNLEERFSKDIYKVRGNFSGLRLYLQNKDSKELFIVHQNASGEIINGTINTELPAHNLSFDFASKNYWFRGVSPIYKSMDGEVTIKVNMTHLFGTSDGITTLTGLWDAERK